MLRLTFHVAHKLKVREITSTSELQTLVKLDGRGNNKLLIFAREMYICGGGMIVVQQRDFS